MARRGLFDRMLMVLLPWLAALLIRLIHRLTRCTYLDVEGIAAFRQGKQPGLYVFWHDQLLLMIKSYEGRSAKVLISASRDGELIARTTKHFGVGAVRGSSRRGGRAAFRELLKVARGPDDLAITPDGPKGPRHQIKDGVIELARISGRPVIPVCFVCSRGIRFNSWDRFLLPLPFGHGVFAYGQPLCHEPGEDAAAFRERLQQAMADNEAKAVACLRNHGLSPV